VKNAPCVHESVELREQNLHDEVINDMDFGVLF